MSSLIEDYLKQYQEVSFLPEEKKETLQEWMEKCPSLVKGWFELAHLSLEDRLQFFEDYWLKVLPYAPPIHEKIHTFFSQLMDVQIFIVKTETNPMFEAKCLYPTKNGKLFIGSPPISEQQIASSVNQLNVLLPEDYLAFFRIHEEFIKKDIMRVFPLEEIPKYKQKITEEIISKDKMAFNDRMIDPSSLIPFACSENERVFQCFFKGWYPQEKLGNVCLDLENHQVSGAVDQRSFRSFLDWLFHD